MNPIAGRVRPAVVADAADVGRVHAAAWRAGYRGIMPDDFLNRLADPTDRWTRILTTEGEQPPMPQRPLDGSRTLLVEDTTGRVVGICSIGGARGDDYHELGELWMLNLDPDVWGTGLAHLLHTHAINQLRDWGYPEAILWVVAENGRARRFYEREGWQPAGGTLVDHSRGFPLSEVRYRIRLNHDGGPHLP
jgi:GNAT superfamily N-acetyltransferase